MVLGASGATGKLVVENLIKKEIQVRIVVRESANINSNVLEAPKVEVIRGNINDFDIVEIKELIKDCDSVILCLGHNISFKGIYGPPYRLVSNTVKKIIKTIQALNLNIKLVLMSTTAYTNKKIEEKNTFGEKIIFSLLNILLPPHRDNMIAADYLVYKLGSNSNVDWVSVRPDSLTNEESVSEYEIHNQKVRSPIFNSGKTSRINVSHFMAELITNDELWEKWKHKTPVIYNKE